MATEKLYLKQDRIEKPGHGGTWITTAAWRIVDAKGVDRFQPWFHSKREAMDFAKAYGFELEVK